VKNRTSPAEGYQQHRTIPNLPRRHVGAQKGEDAVGGHCLETKPREGLLGLGGYEEQEEFEPSCNPDVTGMRGVILKSVEF